MADWKKLPTDWQELLTNPFTGELESGRQERGPMTSKTGLDWLLDVLTYPGEKTETYKTLSKYAPPGINPADANYNRFDSGLVTKKPFSGGELVLDPGSNSVKSEDPVDGALQSNELQYIINLLGIK